MAIVKTDDTNYRNIVNHLNRKLEEKNAYKPFEIAERIKNIEKTKDFYYAREKSVLNLNKAEILLSPEHPKEILTVNTNSNGSLVVNCPISGTVYTHIDGRNIIFESELTPKSKDAVGISKIQLLKTENFSRASTDIQVSYYDPIIPLDIELFNRYVTSTSVVFSQEIASLGISGTPLNADGSIICIIKDNVCTIYSKNYKGIVLPPEVANTMNLSSYQSLDLSGLVANRVYNTTRMFYNFKGNILDLSNFNARPALAQGMFAECQVSILNLSSFSTNNLIREILEDGSINYTGADDMFKNCTATKIYCHTEEDRQRFINSANCTPSPKCFIVGKPE